MSTGGNAFELIGEKIGGDSDDYVLSELGIPSVTAELGRENQYSEEWANKNVEEAYKICSDNADYLDFTFQKIGAQLALQPVNYQVMNDKYMRVLLNVTNVGLSDFSNIPGALKGEPGMSSLIQTDDWIF